MILIDERAGVRCARARGFMVTGTLGILVQAARFGFIPIDEALESLGRTNFRHTAEFFAQTRELAKTLGGLTSPTA